VTGLACSRDELVALRRDLHAHPELRFTEERTSATIRTAVEELARRFGVAARITEVAGTGLVVEVPAPGAAPHVSGGPRGVVPPAQRRVLLRADMDAYPVTEETGLPFASGTPGVAHACGHDVHMTVLVGVLAELFANPPASGTVTALFQPAEEIPYGQPSGARTVLGEGVLAGSYDAVLGLHSWPDLPAGVLGVNPVISMAAKDAFRLDITGRAAHVATASRGRDAILAAAALVQALHAALGRSRDAGTAVGFNIGTITGGASQSQVAPTASLTGTLRTHEPAVRQRLRTVVEQVAAGTATTHDVGIALTWADEMPAVVNDPRLVALAHGLATPELHVVSLPQAPMTADDFALLTTLGPGLYLKLGSSAPGETEPASLHSAHFQVDEACLDTGITALNRLTRQVLAHGLTRTTDGAGSLADLDRLTTSDLTELTTEGTGVTP